MKPLALASVLALSSAAAAQGPIEPSSAGGMIHPVLVGHASPAPPQPTIPRCHVVMIPTDRQLDPSQQRAGPLVWNVTWQIGPSTTRSVIQFSLDEWAAIVQDTTNRIPNPYPITIGMADFGPTSTALASTSVWYNGTTGDLITAEVQFNTRVTFFIDPTPGDDSEFTCTGCTPVTDFDLLTVARHELGHALGFVNSPRVQAHQVGNNFDPTRLNIAIDPATGGGLHTSATIHPLDLMNPGLGVGQRRPIQLYTNAALVARAYEYSIPLRFVDPAAVGSSLTGTVNQPFTTVQQAMGSPRVLFAPTTHHVPLNTLIAPNSARDWMAARGGALITAP